MAMSLHEPPNPIGPMGMIKTIFTNLLILLLLLIIFDVIMFFFLPNETAFNFGGYRETPAPHTGGNLAYPRDYFVKDAKRGFDIGKNKQGHHWVSGITYPIWSNSIGCFD